VMGGAERFIDRHPNLSVWGLYGAGLVTVGLLALGGWRLALLFM